MFSAATPPRPQLLTDFPQVRSPLRQASPRPFARIVRFFSPAVHMLTAPITDISF